MEYRDKAAFRDAWRQSYRETTVLLSENGNRLLLTEAGILSLLPVLFYAGNFSLTAWLLSMQSASETVTAAITVCSVLLHLLFTLLLSLPLWLGNSYLACRVRCGKEAALPDLFHAFRSRKNYCAYLGASFRIWWRALLTAAVLFALFFRADDDGFDGEPIRVLRMPVLIAAILWMSFLPRIFRFPAKTDPEIAARTLAQSTSVSVFGRLLFFSRFFPWFLLGVATVGVTLLWDTVPRMLLMYENYCRKLRFPEQNGSKEHNP